MCYMLFSHETMCPRYTQFSSWINKKSSELLCNDIDMTVPSTWATSIPTYPEMLRVNRTSAVWVGGNGRPHFDNILQIKYCSTVCPTVIQAQLHYILRWTCNSFRPTDVVWNVSSNGSRTAKKLVDSPKMVETTEILTKIIDRLMHKY